MLGSLISRLELFEDTFYFYQNLCVLFGGSLIDGITLTIKCKLQSIMRDADDETKEKLKPALVRMNILIAIFTLIIFWSGVFFNLLTIDIF